MVYQPNEFVNPNQRGVELPAGCKDLHELLQKTTQKPTARPIFGVKRGSLKDVPNYVQRVYMEPYGLSLVVTIRAAEAILLVHNRHTGCSLTFLAREQHKLLAPVIHDFSGKVGFREEGKAGLKLISAPLPHLWLEAAQIVENVIRGYDIPLNSDLLFYFRWREE